MPIVSLASPQQQQRRGVACILASTPPSKIDCPDATLPDNSSGSTLTRNWAMAAWHSLGSGLDRLVHLLQATSSFSCGGGGGGGRGGWLQGLRRL